MENKEFLKVEMTEGPSGQAEGISLTSRWSSEASECGVRRETEDSSSGTGQSIGEGKVCGSTGRMLPQ